MKKFLRLLPETRLDLTAGIYTTFVLAVQRIVLEIVKSYSWIIWCDKNLKRKQEKPCIFIWKLSETLIHIPSSAVWRLSRWPLRTMITSQAPNENWKCIIKYKYIYQRVEKCEVPSHAWLKFCIWFVEGRREFSKPITERSEVKPFSNPSWRLTLTQNVLKWN